MTGPKMTGPKMTGPKITRPRTMRSALKLNGPLLGVMLGLLLTGGVLRAQYPSAETLPLPDQELSVPEGPPPALWNGDLELGLDGSDGNSQTLNFRFGFDVKRKTKYHVLSLDLDYKRDSSDAVETAHRMFLDWRWERSCGESPWTWFVHGTTDYDEFQAFNVRIAVDSGLGYRLIKTDATSLLGRLGGGFSHEIGGPDDSYVPEAAFGLDLERQLTKRQKLAASVDYSPNVTNFNDCRINTKIGWKLLLDEKTNLSLKLSALDRYDSTPNGAKPHDLDYSATLLWSF